MIHPLDEKFTIIITGKAGGKSHASSEYLDVECDEDFVEYIHNKDLKAALIDGYMSFQMVGKSLHTVTRYHAHRELTDAELRELGKYTQGQWSDGIGEGFEQYPCGESSNGKEMYISPWYYGQTLEITQKV